MNAHARCTVRVKVPPWLWLPLLTGLAGGAALAWGGHALASLVLLAPSALVLGSCVRRGWAPGTGHTQHEQCGVWIITNEPGGGSDTPPGDEG
jgi:hypothetical protein